MVFTFTSGASRLWTTFFIDRSKGKKAKRRTKNCDIKHKSFKINGKLTFFARIGHTPSLGNEERCNNQCKALIPPQFCASEAYHVEQDDLHVVDFHALDPLLEEVRGLEPENHLEVAEKAEGLCPCQQDSQTMFRHRPAIAILAPACLVPNNVLKFTSKE